MTNPAPRVSILILNTNGWQDTLECLESVFRLDYPNYQVILCDNGSVDGSVDRIREWLSGVRDAEVGNEALSYLTRPPVKKPLSCVELDREGAERGNEKSRAVDLLLIQNGANRGFAVGNNIGLRYMLASGGTSFVWLLNNDTVVAPDSLRHMVDLGRDDPTIGAIGATMLEYRRPEVIQFAGGQFMSRWTGMAPPLAADTPRSAARQLRPKLNFICGGCLLVPVSVLERVGLLDERFFVYAEDADFCFRVAAAGYAIAYAPAAEIWHKGGATTVPQSPFNDFHNVRSALLLARKYRPALFPIAFLYSAYRFVLPKIARRQWERLSVVVRAYGDVLGVSRPAQRPRLNTETSA